jgi:pimeloyl-ACP methyl ester carboxylesterase
VIRPVLALAAALSALALAAAAPAPQHREVNLPAWALKPGRMVDVGEYKLNLYCFGEGAPTVLMLSGGGWGAVAYSGMVEELGRKTRVCAYDRAAAGFSDAGPAAPAPDQSTRDLEALIRNAELKGPFVLVGWSLGGMEARGFTYRHPEQAAGLVTIDGSTFDYEASLAGNAPWAAKTREIFTRCRDLARAGTLEKDEAQYALCRPAINPLDFYPPMRAAMEARTKDPALYERQLVGMEQIDAKAAALRAARRPLGDLPFRALVAGSHFPDPAKPQTPEAAKEDQDFIFASFQIASSAENGCLIAIPRTTHGIHLDKPAVVIEAINSVVDEVRGR